MRHSLWTVLIVLLPVCASTQEPTLPVPDRVKVDAVPDVPLNLVNAVSPYGQFRQASLLGWHPVERRMLISTSFGDVPQIHEVRGPGAARTQLTFFRDGVTGGALYDPSGHSFIFRK